LSGLAAVVVALPAPAGAVGVTGTTAATGTGVRLRFADDFTGPIGTVPRRWAPLTNWIQTGAGPLSTAVAGWHLDGRGHLEVSAFRRRDGTWRGTIIDTPHPQFTYGVVTFRALVPGGVSGPWSAVWAVAGGPEQTTFPPFSQGGEIDFMEVFGGRSSQTNMALHWARAGGTIGSCGGLTAPGVAVPPSAIKPDATSGWHVFTVAWYPGDISWYVDGVLRRTLRPQDCGTGPWAFDKPHRLRLMMLAGGAGGPPQGPDHYTMLVDYLRVEAPDPARL
jgi:beta-glucanase (GH16 family)